MRKALAHPRFAVMVLLAIALLLVVGLEVWQAVQGSGTGSDVLADGGSANPRKPL